MSGFKRREMVIELMICEQFDESVLATYESTAACLGEFLVFGDMAGLEALVQAGSSYVAHDIHWCCSGSTSH
jgi:hypothetical protein